MTNYFKKGIFASALLATVACESNMEKEIRGFESAANDPLKTELHTLKNGLKIYISRNHNEPKIVTRVAVRAGSKYDPADATGLAHYLEHMLFKGNSSIASLDWEKEKIELKKISDLYEKRRQTTDEDERKDLYQQIDSISQIAAKYTAPNEYDKLISSLGASGTNAYTSNEQTVYVNTIPSNEFDKWATIEANRFSELTLRLFHTELETVYEEFNRSQDSDGRKQHFKMNALLFPNHQYGTQTTIGTGEHLKNPSMEKIHAYFDTYYVPNNMALILTGDVPENAVDIIEKQFGLWKRKELPNYTPPVEKPITEPKIADVFGPSNESVAIAFRVDKDGTDAADKLTLIDNILNNGGAGLLDLDLIQKQKVQDAYSYYYGQLDYGTFSLVGKPQKGQSLEEVKDLLLLELEKVKSGDFEDWLLDAIINDFKKSQLQSSEYPAYRASVLVDVFIKNQSLEYMAQRFDRLENISKEDIVTFANETFGENYVVVNKRLGTDNSTHKVEKPNISPINLNRDTASAFAKKIRKMPETRLKPVFIDYDKELARETIKPGFDFYYIKNTHNELFRLNYVLEMGSKSDPYLGLAVSYLDYLGTNKYTNEAFKKELFKLGLDFYVSAAGERVYVTIAGLSKNLDEGIELLEHLIANAEVNESAYNKLINKIEKQRENSKKNKSTIHRSAMGAYAKYGPLNPYNDAISIDELRTKDPKDLLDLVKHIFTFEHLAFYYGPEDKDLIKEKIIASHNLQESYAQLIPEQEYKELEITENKVYFAHYDMVQAELRMLSKDTKYDIKLRDEANVFNQYFGTGLSSIVFQEIRESKALAYSAYAFYSSTNKINKSNYVNGYIGTQADKLNEAVDALLHLMNDMPQAKDQFEDAKLSALKSLESSRIQDDNIFWNYLSLKKQGLDKDTRIALYNDIQAMTMDDLNAFFNQHIKGKKYHYTVIGNEKNIDFDALNKLGSVQKLTPEELFGY
tara:strand:+ start:7590 stop:10505 length:2916 start_codon:yes stop_codon:yes gene_type:complete